MAVRVYTVTVSDSRTQINDVAGRALGAELKKVGFEVARHVILKDDAAHIQELVRSVSTENLADVIVLTGGTGIAPSDVTTEALEAIFDKRIDGFGEAFRRQSWEKIGARAMLSRATAGVVSGCVVFAIPGNPKAVPVAVELIWPVLEHAVDLATGRRTAHV
jgi:molybdenum cofactor biosynthesis protein B